MIVRVLLLMLSLAAVVRAQGIPSNSPDYFETKVRPLLVDNCFSCHTNSALGGLRLDSPEAALKGGKRGPAIIPGDPDKSILIQAIRHSGDLKMPMGNGNKMKAADIDVMVEWVKAGAVWPKTDVPVQAADASGKYVIAPERRNFWSFQPLRSVQAPAVKNKAWAKSTIDRFILARLEQEGLSPVGPTNKRDLIRRATLDLIGLPPTFEEIQAFEKDNSPDAFAKVVDRLLASPHYGERWGRVWLDVARYGEDDYRSLDPMRRGFNPYPNAFMYRDWVIQAFNDDMPYDAFVKSQLAGDLLDEGIRYKTLPATGFLGLGPWYYDNGAVEVTRADERHDRVDVVTRGFLGLTVACARCHDHKYDPIPQADYYSIAGVFANTAYHEYPQAPNSVVQKYKAIEEEVETKQKLLRDIQTNLGAQLSQTLAFETSKYLEAVFEVVASKKDFAVVVEDKKLDFELLDRWVKYMEKPTQFYSHKNAWQELMKKPAPDAAAAKKLAQQFQEKVIGVMLAKNRVNDENEIIAAKALPGTTPKKRANKPNEFITNDDFCPGCGLQLKNLPEEDMAFYTEMFQRTLEAEDNNQPGSRNTPGVLLFAGWALERRVGSESGAMMAGLRKEIEETQKKLQPSYPFLHGVRDLDNPTNLQLALRGDPYNLGSEVPRHFLSVLSKGEPTPFSAGSGRLELADAILAQPVALRVIVNRIWKGHFGTGIVDTPSNFGVTGDRPSHPDLLEYLATTFVANGMSIKKLHREIMLTAVYQIGTSMDQAAYDKDSGNRLYWRMTPKRLDAESLRDGILAAAGNLDRSLGGPSEGLTPAYKRRTVYGKVSRYKLDEYMSLFDFPSPMISAEKRFMTTVPLQRLFLMNSDFVQIQSEELAKRVASEADSSARIRKMYQLVYGREPSGDELSLGVAYLRAEPMQEYEEWKKKKERPAEAVASAKPEANSAMAADAKPTPASEAAPPDAATEKKPDVPEVAPAPEAPPAQPEPPAGMMAGVNGRPASGPAAPEYEPTPLGRYAKVLFSSSEFMFIN